MKKVEHIVVSSFVAACFCLTPQIQGEEARPNPSLSAPQRHLSTRDSKFVTEATQGNLTEERIGQLLQEKSQNSQLKEFGRKLAADHARLQQELTRIAQKKGVVLPTTIDREHEKQIEHWQKLSAADFDKTVLRDMVRDHEKDIREYEHESKKADDADLRDFAAKKLAALHSHLNQARDLHASVGGKVQEPAGTEKRGEKKY